MNLWGTVIKDDSVSTGWDIQEHLDGDGFVSDAPSLTPSGGRRLQRVYTTQRRLMAVAATVAQENPTRSTRNANCAKDCGQNTDGRSAETGKGL